ncbi:MAG: fumarylacetoacetate hydrolase family protein [Rhodospirillales bacterium]|nr:fumarylacetoacetate hydrolase family protein [Rhodospirillales bacterium]
MPEFKDGYVIAPPPVIAVPVIGNGRFSVRRVFCVGRNYTGHQRVGRLYEEEARLAVRIPAHLSRLVQLAPGDLIFTGTPAGVAAVGRGDGLEGEVEGVGGVRTKIV